MMRIEIWKGDLEELNAFYRTTGNQGAFPEDVAIVAQENEQIIGAVRLCQEDGFLVLRTMQVAEEKRGNGIGKLLLRKATEIIGERECWGVPYSHLERFYGDVGFRFLDDESVAPSHLQERILQYRQKKNGKLYRLMRRTK